LVCKIHSNIKFRENPSGECLVAPCLRTWRS